MKYRFLTLLILGLTLTCAVLVQAQTNSTITTLPPVKLQGIYIVPSQTGKVFGSSSVSALFKVVTSTTICLTGDSCRTTWPAGGAGTGWFTATTSLNGVSGTIIFANGVGFQIASSGQQFTFTNTAPNFNTTTSVNGLTGAITGLNIYNTTTSINGLTGAITGLNIYNVTTTLSNGVGISVSNGGIGATQVTNTAPNFNTTTSVNGLTGAITGLNIYNTTTTLSSNSSYFTFSNGGIGSTALNFLITPVSSTRAINTSGFITGGGDLSADRTLTLSITPVSSTRALVCGNGILGCGDLSADRTLYFSANIATGTISGLTFTDATGTNIKFTSASGTSLTIGNYTGLAKLNLGILGTATSGLDYTLIATTTCSAGQHLFSVSTTGAFACSADSASASAGGADKQLQYNNGGAFAGDSNLTWSSSTQNLTIASATITMATTTRLWFGNATGSQIFATTASSTNDQTGGFQFNNATGTNLFISGVASSSIFQTPGLSFNNATGTNLFISGVASSTNFQTGGLQFNNATGTNAFFSGVASSTNFQTGGLQFNNATGTNVALTGRASSTNVTAGALTLQSVQSGTQCLHASSAGAVTGTGSDCGAGGAGAPTSSLWVSVTSSIVRVASNTLTIADFGRSFEKLSRGTVIKFTNGSDHLAMITSSTSGGGVTTSTFIGASWGFNVTTNTLVYSIEKVRSMQFSYAGTLATSSDAAGHWHIPFDIAVLGADLEVGTQPTTGNTTLDIMVSSSTSIFGGLAGGFQGKPILLSATTTASAFSATNDTYVSSTKYLSLNIASSSVTPPIDLYFTVFYYPLQNRYIQ